MSRWLTGASFRWLRAETPRRKILSERWTIIATGQPGSGYIQVKTYGNASASPLPLHHSLETFLHYATQTNLSPSSTVFRGTKYEYTCLNTLTRLGFQLQRVGGAHDAGIDLEGQWHLPSLAEPLDALVQCKFLTKKSVSPVLVRELDGASPPRRVVSGEQFTVKVLCTPSLATKAVREAVRACVKPVVLASVDEQGWLDALVWNTAMEDFCEKVRVGLRYVGGRKQAVILVNDQIWERDDSMIAQNLVA